MYATIISTEELEQHLSDPKWIVMDCRFDLKNPDWGFTAYQEAHIPGASYAHMNRDLAGPVTRQSGRHPLPDIQTFTQTLERWGISNETQVVIYDAAGGAYAVRLWWMLRFMGHPAVAVLDGGLPKWQQEGRPVSQGVEKKEPATFVPHPDWSMVADADDVDRIRQDPTYKLIDARSPERYRGEVEPIDTAAGHIPGAVNRFYGENLSSDGTFHKPEVLREQFQHLLGAVSTGNTVSYCGSGVTAAHHVLAMELAGLPTPRLYPGSWSEWIRDQNRPIAKD